LGDSLLRFAAASVDHDSANTAGALPPRSAPSKIIPTMIRLILAMALLPSVPLKDNG
jgi:hypothetical protein